MSTNELKVRVISNLSSTQQIMLYQKDIQINVTNYKVGAWEAVKLAPGSVHTAVLPTNIEVAATDINGRGDVLTKQLPAESGDTFKIFDNKGLIDIKSDDTKFASDDETIDIYNDSANRVNACITKDGKPLFSFDTRPDYRVNFMIKPKLYISLDDKEINDDFVDTNAITSNYKVDFTNQQYLTINLDENNSTGAVTVSHSFEKFD